MKVTDIITEAANPAQQAAIAIAMKKAGKKPKQGVAEGLDNKVAKHNAAVAKLPGGQAHKSNHPDILKTAPKGYSFSVSHKLVPDEQGVAEGKELAEEFDLIESIVEMIAEHNGVDAEAVWEDLESLTEDELYVFCLLYTSPSPRDRQKSRMPSSA